MSCKNNYCKDSPFDNNPAGNAHPFLHFYKFNIEKIIIRSFID